MSKIARVGLESLNLEQLESGRMSPMLHAHQLLGPFWAVDMAWAYAAIFEIADLSPKVYAEQLRIYMIADDADDDPGYVVDNGVAVIEICGPMTKNGSWWSSGVSMKAIMAACCLADRDPAVQIIAPIIDSPGGNVAGVAEASDALRNLQKPVMAYYDDMCCSAALWFGSQAKEVWAGRTSQVGSIGVFSPIPDYSRMYENVGISMKLATTGKYKGAGTPGVPISAEQMDMFTARCDSILTHFVDAVAMGRNMTTEEVMALADGATWCGEEAKAVGLVDTIASRADFMDEMRSRAMKMAGKTFSSAGGRTTSAKATRSVGASADNAKSTMPAAALAAQGGVNPYTNNEGATQWAW